MVINLYAAGLAIAVAAAVVAAAAAPAVDGIVNAKIYAHTQHLWTTPAAMAVLCINFTLYSMLLTSLLVRAAV